MTGWPSAESLVRIWAWAFACAGAKARIGQACACGRMQIDLVVTNKTAYEPSFKEAAHRKKTWLLLFLKSVAARLSNDGYGSFPLPLFSCRLLCD